MNATLRLVLLLLATAAGARDWLPQRFVEQTQLREPNLLAPTVFGHAGCDAVDLATGQAQVQFADLTLTAGGLSLELTRTWRPGAEVGLFGAGWRSTLDVRLFPGESGLSLADGAAPPVVFRPGEGSSYLGPESSWRLERTAEGYLEQCGPRTRRFDALGRLVQIATGADHLDLVWEGDHLARVTGAGAALLTITTGPGGLVRSLTDAAGRTATCSYSPEGRLTSLQDFAGVTTTYAYDAEGRLTGLQRAGGWALRLTWDEAGRVTALHGPGTTSSTIHYAARQATVTDAAGGQWTFRFAADGRQVDGTDPAGQAIRKRFDAAGRLVECAVGDDVRTFTWDGTGRLVARTGPDGDEQYAYDESGRLLSVTGTHGVASVTYQATGLIDRFQDAAGQVTRYEYDEAGQLVAVIRDGDRKTTFAWSAGQLTKVTYPDGASESFTFDAAGRPLTATDPAGRKQSWQWDAAGHLAATTDGAGRATQYTHDAAGRLTETNGPTGQRAFRYDPYGLPAGSQVAGEPATALTRDARGRLTGQTIGEASLTAQLDGAGRPVRWTDAAQRVVTASWTPGGQLATLEVGGRKLECRYDARGRLTQRGYAGEAPETYQYDDRGRLVQVKSPAGEWRYEYDAANRLVRQVDGHPSRVRTYRYDDLGRLVEVEDTTAGQETFAYDADGRLLKSQLPGQPVETFAWHPDNRLARRAVAGGSTLDYVYNALGQLGSVTDSRYGRTTYTYDPAGRLTALASPAREQQFTHDAAGFLAGVSDAVGAVRYQRDAAGNLAVRRDGLGRETRYERDAAGRLVREVNPAGQARLYAYDAGGSLARTTREDGSVDEFQRRPDGRLLAWTRGGKPVATREYDAAGRLVKAGSGGRQFGITYDAAGEVAESVNLTDLIYVAYQRDDHARLTSVMLPRGEALGYRYDEAGRLTALTGPNKTEVTLTYDEFGRRQTMTYGAAAVIEYTWQPTGALQKMVCRRPGGPVIYQIGYEYDAAGRVAKADYHGQVYTYTYDARSRLTAATLPDGRQQTYRYDAAGNLVGVGEATWAVNDLDQLTSRGGQPLKWDADGNLVERPGEGGPWTFQYTPDLRLRKATGAGDVSVDYEYDADGRFVLRSDPDRVVYYARAGDEVVAEIRGGETAAAYLNGPGIDERLARVAGGQRAWYVTDLNGSVVAVLGDDGQILNRYLYEPYGGLLAKEETVPNEYLFHGRWRDPVTGLYDFRARWYDPESRRFIQRDPLYGDPPQIESWNTYAFALNNPVNVTDPRGLAGGPSPIINIPIPDGKTWVEAGNQILNVWQRSGYKGQLPGEIPTFSSGTVPEGFRPPSGISLIDRRGWLYDVWVKLNPDGKSFQMLVRDLNWKAEGQYGQANLTGNITVPEAPVTKPPVPVEPPVTAPKPPPAAPVEPPPGEAPGAGPKPGEPPPGWGGRLLKWGGRALLIYGAYHSAKNIYYAENPWIQTNIEAGGWLGSFLLGGAMGSWAGPPGMIIGGIAGWIGGRYLGDPNTYKPLFGTNGDQPGGYVSAHRAVQNWYCTNRPNIASDIPVPDVLKRGPLDVGGLEEMGRLLDARARYWQQRGVDPKAIQAVMDQTIQALRNAKTKDDLPGYLRDLCQEEPDPAAVDAWRSLQAMRAHAFMLHILSSNDQTKAARASDRARAGSTGPAKVAWGDLWEQLENADDPPASERPPGVSGGAR